MKSSLNVNVFGNVMGILCRSLTENATQNKKLENINGSLKKNEKINKC
jgi:hypothetical protein